LESLPGRLTAPPKAVVISAVPVYFTQICDHAGGVQNRSNG
jgi:hypothetical protein